MIARKHYQKEKNKESRVEEHDELKILTRLFRKHATKALDEGSSAE